MIFVLCAASGLRFGETLGIEIQDMSTDCCTIKIRQKAWRGQIHDFLKTENGIREVDLHPTVAMLRNFIGDKQSGLLFCSKQTTLANQYPASCATPCFGETHSSDVWSSCV
jgi:hypothetical protein